MLVFCFGLFIFYYFLGVLVVVVGNALELIVFVAVKSWRNPVLSSGTFPRSCVAFNACLASYFVHLWLLQVRAQNLCKGYLGYTGYIELVGCFGRGNLPSMVLDSWRRKTSFTAKPGWATSHAKALLGWHKSGGVSAHPVPLCLTVTQERILGDPGEDFGWARVKGYASPWLIWNCTVGCVFETLHYMYFCFLPFSSNKRQFSCQKLLVPMRKRKNHACWGDRADLFSFMGARNRPSVKKATYSFTL